VIEVNSAYVSNNERSLLVRLHFVSLQTTPLAMRSSPRFDYQVKHLIQARSVFWALIALHLLSVVFLWRGFDFALLDGIISA